MTRRFLFVFFLLFRLSHCYQSGDLLPLYYNKLFSPKTQLTYSYASQSFICPPSQTSRTKSAIVFDEDIRGDRLVQSDYKIHFLENQECKLLCKRAWSVEDAIHVEDLISNNYQVEWVLDGLPGATVSYTNEAPEHNYRIGFPLGFKKGDNTYINNHVVLQILYTKEGDVIGFEVYPDSIAEDECMKKSVDYEYQEVTGRRSQVTFTYSVKWKQVQDTEKRWQSFVVPHQAVDYSVLNGVIVDGLLFVVISVILFKTMSSSSSSSHSDDIKTYDDTTDDFVGWKLIHRDVFRRPMYGGLLTPLMGTGIQFMIIFIGLICAVKLEWCQPIQPGSLTRWFTLLFLFGSVPGAYWSARMYKVFRGKSWVLNSFLTACVVPGCLIILLFIASMIAWIYQSSIAMSLSGWFSLCSIWLFCALPLTYLGAYFGERADRIENPSRSTQIPRLIPNKKWYQLDILRIALAGIAPFAVIFLDWHQYLVFITRGDFVMSIENTIWNAILMMITVSEITIIFIFLQLCSEDHHWWWPSFLIGASPTLYLFGYSIFYLFQKSEIVGLVSITIYVLRLTLLSGLIAVCTGTLGFVSVYLIIKRIYSTVKID
ncbi:MAG: hypothetical protein EXX96DRAFT_5403 [Benjaminiella poitrasii]|nr:MAG: hypothetical protein EXX96DRAFT_5403 [Benjaminiella poitrasii]